MGALLCALQAPTSTYGPTQHCSSRFRSLPLVADWARRTALKRLPHALTSYKWKREGFVLNPRAADVPAWTPYQLTCICMCTCPVCLARTCLDTSTTLPAPVPTYDTTALDFKPTVGEQPL